jgi:hypothetical protein
LPPFPSVHRSKCLSLGLFLQVQLQPGAAFTDPGFLVYLNDTRLSTDTTNVSYTFANTSGAYTNIVFTNQSLAAGTYTIIYAVRTTGFVANATRLLIVADTIQPVITLVGSSPLLWQAREPFVDPGRRAADVRVGGDTVSIPVNVSGFVNVSAAVDSVFELTYTADDASGNRATVTRTVIIVDRRPPLVVLRGNASIVLEATLPFVDPGIFANDTVTPNNLLAMDTTYMRVSPGNASFSSRVPNVTSFVPSGTVYLITYIVRDESGNRNTTSRSVRIEDTIPPQLNLTGGALVRQQATEPFVDPGWTAFDALDGNLTQDVIASGEVNMLSPAGSRFVRSYSVVDAAGNRAVRNRTVLIFDDIPPVITLLGSSTVEWEGGSAFEDQYGATAFDLLDGNISSLIVTTSNVNGFAPAGTIFTLSYTATDRAGNRAIPMNRSVLIVDTTAPSISLSGSAAITWQAGVTYSELGVVAQDALDGILTDRIVMTFAIDASASNPPLATNVSRSGPISALPAGLPAGCVMVVTSRVTDRGNNTAILNRTVIIVDTLPPTITVLGSSLFRLRLGALYHDAGAVAWDLAVGNCTATLLINVSPAPFSLANLTTAAGTYVITYTAFDGFGNQASVVGRTVIVLPPVPEAPSTEVSLSFDLAASLESRVTNPDPPVSQIVYFVPAGLLSDIMVFLASRGAPARRLFCNEGGVTICTLDAPRLTSTLLDDLAANNTLTAAISPFALPVSSYMGVLDCRPVPLTTAQASALLTDAGLSGVTDLRCDGVGLCMFTTTQAETRWRAALPPAVRTVKIVPRIMPIPRYRIQVRLRNDPSADDFVTIYARTKVQPTSLACTGDTCTVGTFGSTQDAYTQSLTSLSAYLTESIVRRFDTVTGSLVFNSSFTASESLCNLALLTASIAPSNVAISGTTCSFLAYDDVSDDQLGQLRAFPAVLDVSVDFAVTLPSAAAATTVPRLFRGSVTTVNEIAARTALAQLALPQPSTCSPSQAFDGMVDCVIESADPISAAQASMLAALPNVRATKVLVQVSFSALFQEALQSQIGARVVCVCVCVCVCVYIYIYIYIYICVCEGVIGMVVQIHSHA